jgi:hypothetical protein
MCLHGGARSRRRSRAPLIQRVTIHGWTVTRLAGADGIRRQMAHKWLARYRTEGGAGRPLHVPAAQIPAHSPRWHQSILEPWQIRLTVARITTQLKLPRSTVARVLQRGGALFPGTERAIHGVFR